jgi:large subunit ribosomal protein L25
MPEITLAAEVGRPLGSRNTRRLRREGKIPGVIYGHGSAPLAVAVVGREFRTALSGEAGLNTLLTLDAGGTTYLTLAREIQLHPVKGTVNHVDFVIVRRDEIIAAEVPISLVGEALEVQRGDGLVDQQLFNLSVRALPTNIPSSIEVDVSDLVIGGAVRVSDLTLPDGVTTEVDGDAAVVIGQPPRVVVEEVAEGELAEGEVAEGEAAEGGAPAEAAADESSSEG